METRPEVVEKSIASWLTSYIAEVLGISVDEIDETTTFGRFGLDSSAAVALAGDLGDWIGCDIDAAIAYDFPSIGGLSAALSRDPEVCASFLRSHPDRENGP
jgi:acyl carrier protein